MRFLLIFFILVTSLNSYALEKELDSLYSVLELDMYKQQEYLKAKEERILNLKSFLNEKGILLEQVYYLNKRLIREYIAFSFDSTLHYINLNIEVATQLNNLDIIHEALLSQANLFASSGRYKEAEDVLSTINSRDLSIKGKIEFYITYQLIYSELGSISLVNEKLDDYSNLYFAYCDSFFNVSPKNTESYYRIQEEHARLNKNLLKARQINTIRLSMTKMGERDYSIVCFDRSLIYELEQDVENQKKYLCLSAISDIRGAILDNASLTILSQILKNENEVDKAFEYINFAFNDAVSFNSRLRFLRISGVFPIITASYELKSAKYQRKLTIFIILIGILFLGLLFAVLYILRQVKNISITRNELQKANESLNEINQKLNISNDDYAELTKQLIETNHIKEQYIANFLSRCSNYIDKLEDYRKMVKKMIVGRQVSELLHSTNSKLAIKQELQEFYINFDSTFLNIYPNFVSEINKLIDPSDPFIINKGELLNTELRIFALIRLGITDSSKIAKLLRYSVNTIYNYRVKVKNKAIVSRNEFENLVLKIGTTNLNPKKTSD